MARELDYESKSLQKEKIITLTKKEAVLIISYLSGILAQECPPGGCLGAIPTVKVAEYGKIKYLLSITIDSDEN